MNTVETAVIAIAIIGLVLYRYLAISLGLQQIFMTRRIAARGQATAVR